MELKTESLKRSFPDFVFDADVHAEEGELVCLLGPSGCGKTTALQLIAGILAPDRGKIFLGQREITDLPPWERNIGLVFQDYALFPHMTVQENIAYGLRQHRESGQGIRRRVEELLSLVQLPGYRNRKPHELSGGEKQRVALARAIAPSPSLLLLDEPLSALDARLRVQLRREIRQIQQRIGLTTIYVTHDQEEALGMSDRIIMLRDGLIEQTGTPQELYHAPRNSTVAAFIGSSNLLPAGGEEKEHTFYFFRPEETNVSRERPGGNDKIFVQLTVRSVEYAGSHYVVEGSDGETTLRAHLREERTDTPPLHLTGESCWFSIAREKVKILPE